MPFFKPRGLRSLVPAHFLLLGVVAVSLAAAAAPIAAQQSEVGAAASSSVINGDLLPVDLYPDNCLVSGVPETPREPVLQSDIFLLDRSKSSDEQFVASTATVWREPCNRERSVLLIRVDFPSGSSVPWELPQLIINRESCPVFFGGGFAVRLDDYRTRALFVEADSDAATTESRLFSLAVQGLDEDQRPIDVFPLTECDINQPVTLGFSAMTDFVRDGDLIRPGSIRINSLEVPAFDPDLYAETMLSDLLTGHVTGAYFDPNFPGEGIQVEISPVPGGQIFVLTWFTFDDAGNPFWLVGTQIIEPGQRTVDLELQARFGGRFAALAGSSTPQAVVWGNLSLSFDLCNTLDFSFESTHDLTTMPRGSGQRSWVRLTEISNLGCD